VRLPHLPGAVEPPLARRRRLRAERRTRVLAAAALGAGGALAVSEVARVWHRGSAPLPTEAPDMAAAGAEAFGQALEVAVRGYQEGSERENALLNLLGSFTLTWALVRSSTHVIHRRGRWGPFRDIVLGPHHIHHFVPGIALAFLAGGAALLTRNEGLEPWLAVPFGAGVALTLDESALLLELEDVYWTEEGVLSLQISAATAAALGSMAAARRLLRRGEEEVLSPPVPGPEAAPAASVSR
jgi:hypothetical protein